MRIQYFSDLHLEFGALSCARTTADVIVAAGDIGLGAGALDWLRAHDKPILYVAGNHEYYGGDIDAVEAELRAACAAGEVHFLERDVRVLAGVRFVGTTLWTDFEGGDARLMQRLGELMNDYVHIRHGDRPLTPADVLVRHHVARNWLEQTLATPHAGPTVVITHHAPLPTSWPASAAAPLRAAYCNDLAPLLDTHRVDLWIHGHVHTPADYRAGRARVVCNPRGYAGTQLVPGFDPARCVTLD